MKILRSYFARITFAEQEQTFAIPQESGQVRGRLRRMSAVAIHGGIGEDISFFLKVSPLGVSTEYRIDGIDDVTPTVTKDRANQSHYFVGDSLTVRYDPNGTETVANSADVIARVIVEHDIGGDMQSELRSYSVRLDEPVVDSGGTLYTQTKAFPIPLNGGQVRVGLHRTHVLGRDGPGTQDLLFIGRSAFGGVTVEDVLRTESDVSDSDNLSSAAFNRYVVADELVARLVAGDNTSDIIATVTVEHLFS